MLIESDVSSTLALELASHALCRCVRSSSFACSQFYATEAGRAHFANQLNSIRYCVQETCNYDVRPTL